MLEYLDYMNDGSILKVLYECTTLGQLNIMRQEGVGNRLQLHLPDLEERQIMLESVFSGTDCKLRQAPHSSNILSCQLPPNPLPPVYFFLICKIA